MESGKATRRRECQREGLRGVRVLRGGHSPARHPLVQELRHDHLLEDYQMSYSKGACLLCIPEVYPEDSGKYTCTATNIAGCKTASAYLSVQPEEEEEGG
ncbi:titin [Caerostris extrusa]|uniref:Titin n=1 Tax=Caerostris extrusa TaxID=172846 RepID=A0AAV4QN77_CAEEX|nr:titin [Caerostris extrusa]